MGSQFYEKTPDEIRKLGYDFSSEFLTGESAVSNNVSITVTNLVTDADVSASVLVSGSSELSGNIITGRFESGSDGDNLKVLVKTGATNYGNKYEEEFNLIVTNSPAKFELLTNRDEVKRHLKIADSDTSDDQLLDDIMLSMSKYIRQRTKRDFTFHKYESEKVYPITRYVGEVRVEHYPLVAVDSLVLSDYDGTDQTTITDQTTYKWGFEENGYIRFYDGTLFKSFPNYNLITYRAGYPAIPSDIREACKHLTVGSYRLIGKEALQAEKIGDYFYRVKDLGDLPTHIRAEVQDQWVEGVLRRYTRPDMFWAD